MAGVAWVGWCVFQVGQPAPDYETELLHFPTWANFSLFPSGRNEPQALELQKVPSPGGGYIHTATLNLPIYTGSLGPDPIGGFVRDPDLRADRLRTLGLYFELAAGVETPWQTDEILNLRRADLLLPDGQRLTASNATTARRGRLLEFVVSGQRTNATGLAELRLETPDPRRLFLRGLLRWINPVAAAESNTPPLGRLVIRLPSLPASQTPPGILLFYPEGRSTYGIPGPPPTRSALLAALLSITPQTLVLLLVAAGVSLALGLTLVAWACLDDTGAVSTATLAGLGIGLAMVGLGMPSAVLVVPYNGPDEVYHTLSYARYADRQDVMEKLIALGEASHYERFKWQPDVKLSARVIERPDDFFISSGMLSPKLLEQFIPDWRRRSPAMASVWSLTLGWLPPMKGGQILLGLRLLNLLVAAGLLGLGSAVLAPALAAGGSRWIVAAPLLLFPLPVLCAAVTNYAALAASAGLIVACLSRIAIRYDTDWRPALVLGFGLGFLLHTSVNGAVLVATAGLWLAYRPVFRWLGCGAPVEAGREPTRASVIGWWMALAAGFAAIRTTTTALFNAELEAHVTKAVGAGLGARLAGEPLVGWLGLCVTLGLLEVAALSSRSNSRMSPRCERLAFLSSGAGCVALAAAVLALVFLFRPALTLEDLEQPWRQYPSIPSTGCPLRTVHEWKLPVDSLRRGEYVARVLQVFATNFTLRPRDFVLVRGFWTGMLGGEVRVPDWVAPLEIGICLGGFLLGWLTLARSRSGCGTLLAGLTLLVFGVALAGTTAAYWPRNLYGRYAVPLFIIFFLASCLGWSETFDRAGRRHPGILATGLVLLILGLHVTSIRCLIDRFF